MKKDMLSHSLNLSHPCKRISIIDSSFKFCYEKCLPYTLLKSFCVSVTKKGQRKKKWSVVSVSVPQSHIATTVSLKSWRNLCSLKWLNFNQSLVKSLTPVGSWIENNDISCKENNFINIDLKHLMFTDVLSYYPPYSIC